MSTKPLPSKPGSTQSFDGEAKHRRREWAAPLCQFHDPIRALPIKCGATDVMSQSAFNRFAGHAVRRQPARRRSAVDHERNLLSAALLLSGVLPLSAALLFSIALRGSGGLCDPDLNRPSTRP